MTITEKEFDFFSNLEMLNDRVIVKLKPLSESIKIVGSEKENKGIVMTKGKNVTVGETVMWTSLAIYDGIYFKELKEEGSEGKYACIPESLLVLINRNKS